MFSPTDLHNKKFQVYVQEKFNNKISDYFKKPISLRPPMINGMPATPDEYMEKDPSYVQDDIFVPEPIYDPLENNLTISFKSTAAIYEGYQDGLNILFKNPKNMQEMVGIIQAYISATAGMANYDPTLQSWNNKLESFASVLDSTYRNYINKIMQRLPHRRPANYGLLTPVQLLSLFKKG